jgi:hypothetical protein
MTEVAMSLSLYALTCGHLEGEFGRLMSGWHSLLTVNRKRQKEVGRVPLRRPSRPEPTHNNATIRPTDLPMDCQCRAGRALLWDALTAPNQGDTHLPPYWQVEGSATFVGAQED